MEKIQLKESECKKPIPLELPSVSGWKEIPIEENNDPLVPLGVFSDYPIYTSSIYFSEHRNSPYKKNSLKGSIITMFTRKQEAERLVEAQSLLPKSTYLVVLDSYRPLQVQESLFNQYFNELALKRSELSEDELLIETQKYVSLPSSDPKKPSPHNTGGSLDVALFKLDPSIEQKINEIDKVLENIRSKDWNITYNLMMRKLVLINKNAIWLDFGTPFDYGNKEASLSYLEKESLNRRLKRSEIIARNNRRLLYNIMTQVGFEPYKDEWWHYNSPLSQMGAKTKGLNIARYGAVELSKSNISHEKMREDHWIGSTMLYKYNDYYALIHQALSQIYFKAAYDAVKENGDIRQTSLPKASIIKP